jgi:hypothetical protein
MTENDLKIDIHEVRNWIVTVEYNGTVYAGTYGTEPTPESVAADFRAGRLTITSPDKDKILEKAQSFEI